MIRANINGKIYKVHSAIIHENSNDLEEYNTCKKTLLDNERKWLKYQSAIPYMDSVIRASYIKDTYTESDIKKLPKKLLHQEKLALKKK